MKNRRDSVDQPKVSIIILNWNGLMDVGYNSAVCLKSYWEEA
jgi:hypothetical protein